MNWAFSLSFPTVIEHLHLIHSVAPDRVGIYGLVRQDDLSERGLNSKRNNHSIVINVRIISKLVKPIYVHSKLSIVDDEYLVIGSTNMDNMSFFYSSELSATVIRYLASVLNLSSCNDELKPIMWFNKSPELAKETRVRLFQEHLGMSSNQRASWVIDNDGLQSPQATSIDQKWTTTLRLHSKHSIGLIYHFISITALHSLTFGLIDCNKQCGADEGKGVFDRQTSVHGSCGWEKRWLTLVITH